MNAIVQKLFFFALILLMLVSSSCSSSRSYADRKRSKYNKSSYVVKAETKHRKNTRNTKAATKSTRTYKTTNASSLRSSIVSSARKHLGKKYVYGGKTPRGFDCSGFTAYVYNENGVSLVGPSNQQARAGRKIVKTNLQKGDLIFFGKGKVSHVGIVTDVGPDILKVIHSTSSRGVVHEDISDSKYWQSRYLFGRDVISGDLASQ